MTKTVCDRCGVTLTHHWWCISGSDEDLCSRCYDAAMHKPAKTLSKASQRACRRRTSREP